MPRKVDLSTLNGFAVLLYSLGAWSELPEDKAKLLEDFSNDSNNSDDAVAKFGHELLESDFQVNHTNYMDYLIPTNREKFLQLVAKKPNFRLFLVNHAYYMEREFSDLAEAIKHAKSTTFDIRIDTQSDMVCSVSFFGGVKVISEAYRKEIQDITAKQ